MAFAVLLSYSVREGYLMSEGLFFPQQVSGSTLASGSTLGYLNQSFQDYSLPGNSNAGFSSTISTNPLNGSFANDDSSKYFVKTLWINELVQVQDRSLWFMGGRTFNVQFTENFSGIQAFASGAIGLNQQINGKSVRLSGNGSFFSVSGNILRVSFIVKPKVAGSAQSANYLVDGALSTTIQYTSFSDEDGGTTGALATYNFINDQNKYFLIDDGNTQTNNLHTFSLGSVGDGTNDGVLEVIGIVVYLSNDQANVHINPGNTYVNKNLLTTNVGSTFALSAANASLFHLGAKTTYYKNASGNVASSTYQVPLQLTQATGLSGQFTFTVTTGTGASYPPGTGFVVQSGSSMFYNIVNAQSTDTLTCNDRIPWTFTSATLTKAFYAFTGATFGIGNTNCFVGSTQYYLAYSWNPATTYGASNWTGNGVVFTAGTTGFNGTSFIPYQAYYDPENRYSIQPTNTAGVAQGVMAQINGIMGWQGALGIRGDFQAIEFEYYVATSIANMSANIDGNAAIINGYINSASFPNYIRSAYVRDLGIGNHLVNISINSSAIGSSNAVLTGVNFYKYAGNSLQGKLSSIETLQQTAPTVGSVLANTGEYRFYGSDKMTFTGSWIKTRGGASNASLSGTPGFAECVGNSTNSSMTFKYYGNTFAVYTSSNGGSYISTLDGLSIGLVSGVLNNGGSLAEHTVVMSFKSGTFGIQGLSVFRKYSELKCEQSFAPITALTSLDGSLITEKTVSVRRARQRMIGISVGIGGMALSPIYNVISGATAVPVTLGNPIYIETFGNPVLLGLSNAGFTLTTAGGLIELKSGSSGILGTLQICRIPQGISAMEMPWIGEDAGASLPNNCALRFQFGALYGQSFAFLGRYAIGNVKDIDIPPAGKWSYQAYFTCTSPGTSFQVLARTFAMEQF